MNTRYVQHQPLSRARLRDFVALDNLTAQLPLIEIVAKKGYKKHIRVWTAYDPEREHGTYTACYTDGLVATITVYPSGVTHTRVNREANAQEANSNRGTKQSAGRAVRNSIGKRDKRSVSRK